MGAWHERDPITGRALCGNPTGAWTNMLSLVNCDACMTIRERKRKTAQDFEEISNALLNDETWITNVRRIETLES